MLKTTIKTFSDTKLKEQETHLAKPKHKAGMCHNLKTRMEHLERRLKNGSLNLATLSKNFVP